MYSSLSCGTRSNSNTNTTTEMKMFKDAQTFFSAVLDLVNDTARAIRNHGDKDKLWKGVDDYVRSEIWSSAFIAAGNRLDTDDPEKAREAVWKFASDNARRLRLHFKAYEVS